MHQPCDRERVHRFGRVPDEREHFVPSGCLGRDPRGDHQLGRDDRVARFAFRALGGLRRALEVREEPRGFDPGEELDRRRVVLLCDERGMRWRGQVQVVCGGDEGSRSVRPMAVATGAMV